MKKYKINERKGRKRNGKKKKIMNEEGVEVYKIENMEERKKKVIN